MIFKIKKNKEIVNELTVLSNDFQEIKAYRESTKSLYIPMYYGIKKFGRFKGEMNCGESIDIKFTGFLRPQQEIVVDQTLKTLNNSDNPTGTIICLPTGSGKTICAINLAIKLKKKTLIIVHKQFLMNQWIERIKQFAPEARVGIIQGPKTETESVDIVIGMIQSIVFKKYPKEIFETFGTLIYDEVHHLSGKVFSDSFYRIGSKKYTIGLSATPERKDGLTKIIVWHIGEIYTPIDNKLESSTTTVQFHNIYHEYPPEEKYNRAAKLNIALMISELVKVKFRNSIITETILKTKGKILVLSDRLNHLKILYNQLKPKLGNRTIGFYIGKMKETELKKSNESDIILGSYSMCAEGYDCPDLNVLVMASPKSEITQIIGRIFRKKHNEHIIIDFCDNYSVFKIQGYKRKRLYKKLLPDCVTLHYNNNEIEIEPEIERETNPEEIEFEEFE